ncbi:phosphotransferase family protein [Sabulicella rubraurantiaca]|uniref:phosphotransferase family protein n=1 Tax=Sabulicella rubraurantiaca TaxID=2811429 RepID=UPI001A970021|nr:phosphotransferase [Sabulicella rubraurantiaca]
MNLDARAARRHAGAILRRLLGRNPTRVERLGGGLSNHVFAARMGRDQLVLRLNPEPGKVKDFLKEQWAMAQAREAGVPVPEVLEVGAAPLPFMVLKSVPGDMAIHHPERRGVLEALGRNARLIHGIRTEGFGQTFDWSHNRLSRRDTWRDYLRREYRGAERLALLRRHAMLPVATARKLRQTLEALEKMEVQPSLNHGDLRLKNVIVSGGGEIRAILDWEFCTSHAAPWWDLSLALHDLSVDAKEALLRGYGMGPAELREAAPVLRLFNTLNYAQAVEHAASLRDDVALEWLRARLHGALDLYV